MSLLNTCFYKVKPLVPRSTQLAVRKAIAQRKRKTALAHWPINPEAGRKPTGWTGWPEGKKFAFVLMHDVDTQVGHQKVPSLLRLDRSHGFRSIFNFVPERYSVSSEIRNLVKKESCEVGVHGLRHDGTLFRSRKEFVCQARSINRYLKEWECIGFSSPSMHRNLEWTLDFDILCETSTFDTDPFEPQPDGVGTIFPFVVYRKISQLTAQNSQLLTTTDRRRRTADTRIPQKPASGFSASSSSSFPAHQPSGNDLSAMSSDPSSQELSAKSRKLRNFYIELPYTLPQDHCLFVILSEKSNRIWKEKLDWIAENGGMALLNCHPDYMNFDGEICGQEEYPVEYYSRFLGYVKDRYGGQYWNALPSEVAQFWLKNMSHHRTGPDLSELKFDDSSQKK